MRTLTRNMGFDSLRIMLNFYLNIFTIDLPGVRLMVHSLVSSFLPRSTSFLKNKNISIKKNIDKYRVDVFRKLGLLKRLAMNLGKTSYLK